MASPPLSRLTRCGVLRIRQGSLAMSDAFAAHLRAQQARGREPAWDLLATLEQALASWGEYAGDARESARHLVRFLPPAFAAASLHGALGAPGSFAVLDAYIAA